MKTPSLVMTHSTRSLLETPDTFELSHNTKSSQITFKSTGNTGSSGDTFELSHDIFDSTGNTDSSDKD